MVGRNFRNRSRELPGHEDPAVLPFYPWRERLRKAWNSNYCLPMARLPRRVMTERLLSMKPVGRLTCLEAPATAL